VDEGRRTSTTTMAVADRSLVAATATAATCMAATLILRITFVLKTIHDDSNDSVTKKRRTKRKRPVSTLVVLGSGGHTTEMIRLLTCLEAKRYSPLAYVLATSDTTSLDRIEASPAARHGDAVYWIPRSREVGQSYITSIFTTIRSFIHSIYVATRVRPDLVLCNGPGTCLPIVMVVFLLRILGMADGNVVFVESFCRVHNLSLTGKLLYPIVDKFVVHWPELLQQYPRSQLVSTFVKHQAKEEEETKKATATDVDSRLS